MSSSILLSMQTLVDHDRNLRDVFWRLRTYNLKLQPDKCEFLRKVTFLGHKISQHVVETDACNVESVKNFPTPKTVKQLKRFLGLVGYYRMFVPQFSKITAPLHKLLKRNIKYVWGKSQENTIHALKQKLVSQFCNNRIFQGCLF